MDDTDILSEHKPMDEDPRQTEILHRPLHKTLKMKGQRHHVQKDNHVQGLDPRSSQAEIPCHPLHRNLETKEHNLQFSETQEHNHVQRQKEIANNPQHTCRTLEAKAKEHSHCNFFEEDLVEVQRHHNHMQGEQGEIPHNPLEKTLRTKATDLQAQSSGMTGHGVASKNTRFTSLAKIVNHLRTVHKSKEIPSVQADGEPDKHFLVHDVVTTRNASAQEYPSSKETNILSPSGSHSHAINMDSLADHDPTGHQSQLNCALRKDSSGTGRPNKRKHRTREASKQSFGQSVGSDLAEKRCVVVENLVVGEAFVASASGSHVPERPTSPAGQQCAVCKEHVPQASLNSHRCKVGASRIKSMQHIPDRESLGNSQSEESERLPSGEDTVCKKQDHASNFTEVADQSDSVNATGNVPVPVVGGIHKCDRCAQSFSSRGNLSLHLLSHVEVKVHKCNECDRTFRTENMLVTHKRIHAGQHPYQCHVCARTFNKSNTLTCHLRTHSGEKPYQCDLCDKSFTQNSALTVHKRIHSGEEPFRCELCGKTFRDKSNLRRHVRTHSGDQPFECSVCGKRFSTKDHLNTHFRIHTGDRPYQCSMCDKTFRQSSTLVGHMRIHTGELPYKCDVCQKGFRDRSNCSSHMKLHAQYSARSKAAGSSV